MATVYSTQLVALSSLSGLAGVVFTAPPGFRTVITSVNWTTGLNTPLAWATLIHGPSGARFAAVSYPGGTFDFTSPAIEGRWVLNAGDVVEVETDGSTWDLFVSGFELVLP